MHSSGFGPHSSIGPYLSISKQRKRVCVIHEIHVHIHILRRYAHVYPWVSPVAVNQLVTDRRRVGVALNVEHS